MSTSFKIAIAGLGTVGAGVVNLLQKNSDVISARAGRPIEIVGINARDKKKDRGVDLSKFKWHDKPETLVDCGADAVVELIGGSEGSAKILVESALNKGISVVTANKALLAHHGATLAELAEKKNAVLAWEAAVAGGIPIIKTLREGLAANIIHSVCGILNGTCNYILTEMRETGRDFGDVLKDVQGKGYAEADPSFDIDGVDAAHKLCILSALAFGVRPDFKALRVQGIRHVTAQDIVFAGELGYRIKLLGIARRTENGGIAQSVEPCLIPAESPLGVVDGVFNAVSFEADFAGAGLSVGRGAGAGPTASAVVADIIDLVRGIQRPVFGVPAANLSEAKRARAPAAHYYLHIVALDQPGVLADIAAICRDHNVSMEAVIQRGRDPDKPVSIVVTSHLVQQTDIEDTVEKIAALGSVAAKPCLMRIERF